MQSCHCLAKQRPDGDFRPAFELIKARENVGDWGEARRQNIGLARADVWPLDIAEVDHAEMYLTDGSFVIVDKADDSFLIWRFDDHFLVELTAHALAVDVVQMTDFCINRGDVPADTDAMLGMQAGFALAAAALVFEQMCFAVGVGPAEEAVWD